MVQKQKLLGPYIIELILKAHQNHRNNETRVAKQPNKTLDFLMMVR